MCYFLVHTLHNSLNRRLFDHFLYPILHRSYIHSKDLRLLNCVLLREVRGKHLEELALEYIALLFYVPYMVIKVHAAIDYIATKTGHQSILAVAQQWCYNSPAIYAKLA